MIKSGVLAFWSHHFFGLLICRLHKIYNIPGRVFFISCVCVYDIFMYIYLFVFTCVDMSVEDRNQYWISSSSWYLPYFLKQGLSLIMQNLPSRKLQRSSCPYPCSTRITCECDHLRTFGLVSAECSNSGLQWGMHLPSHLPRPIVLSISVCFHTNCPNTFYPLCTFSNL